MSCMKHSNQCFFHLKYQQGVYYIMIDWKKGLFINELALNYWMKRQLEKP